jgi:DNA-binding transcriptional ArsR family regulator
VNRHRRGLVAKLVKSLVTAGLARTRYEAPFILCTVEANPFPADLARALSMPKPSMTFLIKKLEESGYLRRQGEKVTCAATGLRSRLAE